MHLRISIILTVLIWQVASGQNENLKIARNYAERYNPSEKSNNGPPNLENIKNEVINAFKDLTGTEKVEHERYLTLIFIKLYRAHLQCCHQSYDLRISGESYIDQTQDPLLYEFNLLTNTYKQNEMVPFIPSSISYDYVKTHLYLLEYKKIKIEINKIESLLDEINKRVFWKD